MNAEHLRICSSAEWAETVEREILPWALHGHDLGARPESSERMNRLFPFGSGAPRRNLSNEVLSRPTATRAETDVSAELLGQDVLEVGPGPGLTTSVLSRLVAKLTAVEVDAHLADALASRMAGSNVEVVHGDGAALPFADGRFSGAVCFTMLHHVPSAELQDGLFAEVCRVLRPGGMFIGVDSIPSAEWLALHEDDTCVPVDPAGLRARLLRAGFNDAEVELSTPEPPRRFRFAAVSPRG